MKTLKVGIASYEAMKTRTLAIARGQLKPSKQDPTVWFTSAESFAKVLSEKNRALLRVIVDTKPHSIEELAEHTGRAPSNLSRTLKTMARYGLVTVQKQHGRLVPRVCYTNIALTVPLTHAQAA